MTASLFTTLPACSLLTSLDGYSGGGDGGATRPDAASEAGGTDDASTPSDDAADGGSEAAAPNLFPAGTFESDCSGLRTFMSTLTSSPLAHGGLGACRVCVKTSTAPFFTLDVTVPTKPAPGESYHASAWVRTDPASPVPTKMLLALRTAAEQDQCPTASIDESWRMLEIDLPITKIATSMDVYVGGNSNGKDACFILDDLVVQRIAP